MIMNLAVHFSFSTNWRYGFTVAAMQEELENCVTFSPLYIISSAYEMITFTSCTEYTKITTQQIDDPKHQWEGSPSMQ